MSSNIWQKRHKVKNLYEIVLDFNSFNSGLIPLNNSFECMNANNKNNQVNSTFETIYKSSNQTTENGNNIIYKLVIIGL